MRSSVSGVCGSLVLGGLFVLAMTSCGTSSKVAEMSSDADDEVNIGYESLKRDELTSSVSKVEIGESESMAYSNIWDYIAAKVPGVSVSGGSSGTPRIVIRGESSFTSQTQPLFVVDGVVMDDISYLSHSDVAKVEVVKDGSAAIYGLRGANGAILITTKMAKARADAEAAAKKAARQAKRNK